MSINKDIIVVSGYAGSGKDTLAANITKHLGHKKISLADPLKDLTRRCLGREINKGTDRQFLIDLGQYMRGLDQKVFNDKYGFTYSHTITRYLEENKDLYSYFWTTEFWTQIILKEVSNGGKWVIPDMRFKAERQTLDKLKPVFVALDVPRRLCEDRLKVRDGSFNPSMWESNSEKEWKHILVTLIINGCKYCPQVDYDDFENPPPKTEEEIFLEFKSWYDLF